MIKFQRNYKFIYTAPATDTDEVIDIEIKYPLTIEFDIKRDVDSQTNTAEFKIYNLAKSTREQIFQDKYYINRKCFVEFYAGYGDNMPLIFKGQVLEAYFGDEGTEIVSNIKCVDYDIIQSYTNATFEVGTPKKDVLAQISKDMPNCKLVNVGKLEGNLSTPLVISDYSFIALNQLTGGHVFIDNGVINMLQDNEALKDVVIPKITDETGLLRSPTRVATQVEVDCIFSPEIIVGQLIEIESEKAPIYNGQFKVIGVHHQGTISGAICGEVTTTLDLFIGALLPNSNAMWTGVYSQEPLSVVEGSKVSPVTKEILSSLHEVRQYLIKNGTPPNQKITHNINWREVLFKYSEQGEVPSIAVLSNLYTVATRLQEFLDKYYRGNKITITSGWRSRKYNPTVGGASNSAHIRGMALDFCIAGVPTYYVYKNFRPFWGGRTYNGGGWIHCDIDYSKGNIANDR